MSEAKLVISTNNSALVQLETSHEANDAIIDISVCIKNQNYTLAELQARAWGLAAERCLERQKVFQSALAPLSLEK